MIGTVLLLVTACTLSPPQANLDCSYPSQRRQAIVEVKHCAWRDEAGQLHLAADQWADMAFSPEGMTEFFANETWFYAHKDGLIVPVMSYDNFGDPFNDGRARSPSGGKRVAASRDPRALRRRSSLRRWFRRGLHRLQRHAR